MNTNDNLFPRAFIDGSRHACMVILKIVCVCFVVYSLSGCAAATFPHIAPPQKDRRHAAAKDRAENYFIMARQYDLAGLPKQALSSYENAYSLDPSSTLKQILVERYVIGSLYTKAVLLVKQNRREQALPDSDKILLSGIYLRMGQYGHASDILFSVEKKKKEDWFTLGLIQESFGDLAKAASCYAEYLKSDPTSLPLTLKAGYLYAKAGRYAAAESVFVAAAKAIGQNAQLFNAIGEIKMAKGDTTLALDFFKMALVIDSTFKDAIYNTAQIQIQKGHFNEAIPLYERLCENDSSGGVFTRTLALLYFYVQNYEKVKTAVKSLLSNNVEDGELHYYLGLAYESQDSIDVARMEFEKCIVIKPAFSDAWVQLCYLDLRNKQFDEALRTAERFTTALSQDHAAWRTRGYVYNARKEFSAAIPHLKKAVELDGHDVFAFFELGSAYERLHDIDHAAEAFKKVLVLRPRDASAANYLGYMWADRGEKLDSAKKLIETALASDSQNGAYLDSYAWVLFKLNDLNAAYTAIQKALIYIQDDGVVYSHLGDILMKKGEISQAYSAYKKSLTMDPESDDAETIKKKIKEIESNPNFLPQEHTLPRK